MQQCTLVFAYVATKGRGPLKDVHVTDERFVFPLAERASAFMDHREEVFGVLLKVLAMFVC